VAQRIVIGPVCLWLGVCVWVCCHDNNCLQTVSSNHLMPSLLHWA